MSNFKTPLVVSPLPGGKHWKLHTKFTYDDGQVLIEVVAGFDTDFASVPWPFWSFIRPWGRWGKAAVLHDWLYRWKVLLIRIETWPDETNAVPIAITRGMADSIFRDAMGELGVAPWRRNLMYWGVRAFGWLAWRKNR